jgi:hypothetical protein
MPLARPAVLKGVVADWPAVGEGRRSPQALAAYLKGFDRGRPAQMVAGEPSIRGKFFYRDDMKGLNFQSGQAPVSVLLDSLIAQADEPDPPAVALQSTAIPDFLPGFAEAHRLPLVDPAVIPRIWIGNAITVVAHFDPYENLACVVGGRRRFTLIPPDQTGALYVGPLEVTPAGAPVSLVDFDNPDLERHPRFPEAMAAAEVADLEPGDAIYIPYLWWHHVRSLSPFNVLVNYWWNETPDVGSPFDWLMHGMLTIRNLPPAQRAAWRAMFDHYVFRTGLDPAAHIPQPLHGILGTLSEAERQRAKAELARSMGEWAGIVKAKQP